MSYTTRLLTIIPTRDRIMLAAIVVFVITLAVAGSRPAERPEAPAAVQPVIIITATPTAYVMQATGLAKAVERMGVALSVRTAAPLPTAEPEQVQIVVELPTAAPAPTMAEPTAPPRWTMR
jgi:hypothetical protein